MREEEDSFTLQESSQRAPLFQNRIYKPTNPLMKADEAKLHEDAFKRKCINGITKNKINKLVLSQELQEFLIKDDSNFDLSIVSVVGDKKIGKSFLVDCVISAFQQKTFRGMSKNNQGLINCPNILLKKNNDERMLFLDLDGSCGDQEFLWAYFLSSVMIFNLYSDDETAQNKFYSKLAFINSHLEYETQNLSLPKLIIIERDAVQNQAQAKGISNAFTEKVVETGLFDGQLIFMRIPYPGDQTVKSKELLDVSQKNLNKGFLSQIKSIQNLLKTSRPKAIKNNYMTPKLLSLTLDPLTKKINKDRRVNAEKIWEEVIETLSVGFYNYYIMKYSEQLLKEFQEEKPLDKYSLYKKLSAVKRSIDKKVEGFNNIAGDPIFEKYKDKLRDTIDMKEKMIKEVNRTKSRNENQKLMEKLLQNLKGNNAQELIKRYCQSRLDDEKVQVMLQNFDKMFKQRLTEIKRSKAPSKNSKILALEQEIQKIQKQLIEQQQAQNYNPDEFEVDKRRTSIKQKQKNLFQLKRRLQQEIKKIGSNSQFSKQQGQIRIDELKQKIKHQQQQIKRLKQDKSTRQLLRENQLKQTLQKEQQINQQLLKQLQQAKLRLNKKGKDSCCEVM